LKLRPQRRGLCPLDSHLRLELAHLSKVGLDIFRDGKTTSADKLVNSLSRSTQRPAASALQIGDLEPQAADLPEALGFMRRFGQSPSHLNQEFRHMVPPFPRYARGE